MSQFCATVPRNVSLLEIAILRQDHQEPAGLRNANLSVTDDAVQNMPPSLTVHCQEMEVISGNVQPLHEVGSAKTDQCSDCIPELKDALLPGGIRQRRIGPLLTRNTAGVG